MKRPLLALALLAFSIHLCAQRLLPVVDVNDQHPFHPLNGDVFAFTEWNNNLVVGGKFSSFNSAPCMNIMQWNGLNGSAMGEGFGSIVSGDKVTALTTFNDDLVVAGKISLEDVVQSFDGNTWSSLGGDFEGIITDVIVYNGELYACGNIDNGIRKWDGNAWNDAAYEGFNSGEDMEVFDGKLYAIGQDLVGPAIAYFDGTTWTQISTSLILSPERFASTDQQLYICGTFSNGIYDVGLLLVENEQLQYPVIDCPANVSSMVYRNGHYYFIERVGQLYSLSMDNQWVRDFDMSGPTVIGERPAPLFIFSGSVFCAGQVESYAALEGYPGEYGSEGFYEIYDGREVNHLHGNHVSARFDPSGTFFQDRVKGRADFIVPAEEGVGTLYAAALWASGVANADTLVAAASFESGADGWSYGPISDVVDVDYARRYYRTWRITGDMLNYHHAHVGEPNYYPNEEILSWPGNGDFDNGAAHMLAPFVDVDGDSWYEPWDGDYPDVPGSDNVFLILNDQRAVHEEFVEPMNLELHVLAYSFNVAEGPMIETVFMRTTFFNRSENNYEEFRIGTWNDFDLGFSNDDYTGVDSLLNYCYAYNGDAFDEAASSSLGYGEFPPTQACLFLNKEMGAHRYYSNSTNPISGEPVQALDYFYYMQGLTQQGIVQPPDNNGPFGTFMFSDSPCDIGGDTEMGHQNVPGDRRTVASTVAETFEAGDYICFDYAYVYHRTFSADVPSVCSIDEVIPTVAAFYDLNLATCSLVTAVEEKSTNHDEMLLYPNPGKDELTLVLPSNEKGKGEISIMDSYGNAVKRIVIDSRSGQRQNLNVADLAPGVYYFRYQRENTSTVSRWIKM